MSERGGGSAEATSRGRREGSTRCEGELGQRGFSLIELIVAILILTVGILGLAATAGQVTKMVAWGGRYGASAVVASAQIEQLRATPCASLAASGTATKGIYSLSWTVTASGFLRTITLTVSYPNGRSTRSDVFETYRSCV
jgi:prepilin-type N-terminal cleavage/methylation domain-containing protein